MNIVYIFVGGGIGSVARYLIGRGTLKMFTGNFPLGTFLSNTFACLILGLVVYAFSTKTQNSSWIQPLIVIGFCGGFSTFSTFSNETMQLFQAGNYFVALINILLSLLVGIGIIYFLSITAN